MAFHHTKDIPTRKHIDSLEKWGITDIHRITFSPVSKYI